MKGDLKWVTKKLDVDVIVSGTREKSHKPDEVCFIYFFKIECK